MSDRPPTLGILGGGRAAWAYGSAWRRVGWPITGVWLRQESTSRLPELLKAPRRALHELSADLLLVAVSDRAIAEVVERIPETDAIIFHASGSLTALRGGFSLHPLKSLPPVGQPSDLENTLLVFEGSRRETARRIARDLGARFAEVTKEQKARYHAGAVFGSNYVALMLDLAEELIGIENVKGDLVALAVSAMENWRKEEGARRFTGPAVRGDQETLERHLEALKDDPETAELYRLLAARIVAAAK
ncbi:MAG TPA: Rossmann-like and DUF2520 domain-containing protein [Thermoanaerobaculia bacterium]|jgi:predicted short-subunit dehydrogenase-like oxidoreductase (DUF2520 family)|nr:Rossmann-like and DUF2520 domain-containing protein [Thermoanaerobaculia bacterium]